MQKKKDYKESRIWFTGWRRNKKIIDADYLYDPEKDDLLDVFDEFCHKTDVPHPMILQSHMEDFADFGRMRLHPADFIESVAFDRLDVEIIYIK